MGNIRRLIAEQESRYSGIRANDILKDPINNVNPLFADKDRLLNMHRRYKAAMILTGRELCPEDQAISANYAGVFQQARRD